MLEVKGLSATYGRHRALSDIDVNVEPGEIVVILGANGAGKSTLLKCIAGICEGQVEGDISLDDRPILGAAAEQIVENGIAFVPEGRGIFGELNVEENLALGAYCKHARASKDENLQRVYSLFPKLAERRHQISRTMSGGEQQMVAIGRAMMSDPTILMLDEPSLGLSPLLCKELFLNLANIRESGLGILLVEQNAKQSLAIADRGYLIENGEITGEDSAQNLLNDHSVQKAYLGGAAKTPDNFVATGTLTANRDSEHAMVFIQPNAKRSIDDGDLTSNSLAGENIDEIVARAAGTFEHGRSRVAASGDGISGANATLSNPSIANGPVHADPQIGKMLAAMEQAAQTARGGNASIAQPNYRRRSEAVDGDQPFPEIPVYRKSSIEIYRRGADGKLGKMEKR